MSLKKTNARQIVQAATELVAERGMESLNARAIAERCGCSTQPIYLSFANLQQLKDAVVAEILACYDKYISNEIASGKYPEYKASGMGYIRFAKERPNFFKYLFMRNRDGDSPTEEAQAYQFRREATRALSYGFDEAGAERIHTHMWIYVHGIATMYATGYLSWDWDVVSKLLTEEFFAVKNQLLGGVGQ